MIYVIIVFSILIFLIGVFFVIGFYFYHFAIKRSKKAFIHTNDDLHDLSFEMNESNWIHHINKQEVRITSHDGLNLYGQYMNRDSKKTVILVHGYTGKGLDMVNFAKLFYETYHFNVLLPDLRGHGKSEGNYIGFSHHDHLDLRKWIDLMVQITGDDAEIVLLGISMGAATVCAVSGASLPKQVKLLISDCAFDSIHGQLAYQLKRMYKLPSFPIIHFTSLVCKLKAGYFFGESTIIDSVSKCQIPMLFIHGEQDRFVPLNMVYHLYNTKQGEKELLIIEDARHAESFSKGKKQYIEAIEHGLNKYLS